MISNSQKERAQKVIPGGTRKTDSSAKSLNDIKKSKSKSAKNYPRRHDKKKESSAKSLNDIKKSKRKGAKSYPRRHEGPKETQASSKPSQETPRHFAKKTSKLAEAFDKNWSERPQDSNASTIFFEKA